MGASNTEGPRAPMSCKGELQKNKKFNMENLFGQIWHRLRKCVMNSFTTSVEKQARASVHVTKLTALFLVNVEDTVPKSKKVKC